MRPRDIFGLAAVVLAVLALTLQAGAERKVGAALAVADRAEEAVRVIAAQRDSARARADSLEVVSVEQAETYTVDSLAWAGERDAARLRVDAAETDHRRTLTTLRASLTDSTLIALTDSVEASHRRTVVGLTVEIQGLHAERASLWRQRFTLRARIVALEDERSKDRSIIAEQGVALAVLRSVAKPSLWNRVLSFTVSPQTVTGVGIGLVIGFVARGP